MGRLLGGEEPLNLSGAMRIRIFRIWQVLPDIAQRAHILDSFRPGVFHRWVFAGNMD